MGRPAVGTRPAIAAETRRGAWADAGAVTSGAGEGGTLQYPIRFSRADHVRAAIVLMCAVGLVSIALGWYPAS